MTGFIAVHCGAGEHKQRNIPSYNKLSKLACKAGISVLNSGGTALEAVKEAVIVLENNPLTNAGYGSNLTMQGVVEVDAAVMDGRTLLYGGCAAVKKIKNPVELAYDLCIKQNCSLPLGLVPPSLLVGKGALDHAKNIGLKVVHNKYLVTPKALRQFKKYKTILDWHTHNRLDTVGAVCIDDSGHVAAASSSGNKIINWGFP